MTKLRGPSLQGDTSLASACCSRSTGPCSKSLAAGLASRSIDTTTSSATLFLEHGRMPQHVGQDEVTDLGATKIHLLQVRDLAVPTSHGNALKHRIHVVLAVHQVAAVHLSSLQLAGHGVANALVEQLHRNAGGRHGC